MFCHRKSDEGGTKNACLCETVAPDVHSLRISPNRGLRGETSSRFGISRLLPNLRQPLPIMFKRMHDQYLPQILSNPTWKMY
jgi:hypothetical protein